MSVEEIVAALQAIIDAADAEGRDLTDDEVARYEELEGKLTAARRSAELRARQVAYTTPAGRPLQVAVVDEESPERRAFRHYLRTGEARLEGVELRAQGVGVDAAGGYAVPDEFRDKLVERIKSFGGIAAEAEEITTDSGATLQWPTIDDTANIGEIVPEHAKATTGADLVFGQADLGAYKYEATGAGGDPLKVSWELLQDARFDVEDKVSHFFALRIARKQAIDWATGDGTGEPLGLVTAKTAYDEIGSNTAGPTYAELVATVHALDPAYRANAKWVLNDATLGRLEALVDLNGRPLYADATAGLEGGAPSGRLLGYPVVIDQGMPSIGDEGKFVVFGDIRQAYVIRRVQGFSMVVLREKYAEYGQVGFIGWERADGTPQDLNAYVVLGGENTA